MPLNTEEWYFVAQYDSTGQRVPGTRRRVKGQFQAQKMVDERNKKLTPEEHQKGNFDIEPADPPTAPAGPRRASKKWKGPDNRQNRR
jgi:hypothetical protein